jgi:hypothetical protein
MFPLYIVFSRSHLWVQLILKSKLVETELLSVIIATLNCAGARAGVIDCTPVRHTLRPIAKAYDTRNEIVLMKKYLPSTHTC